ncbi:MAG: glycerol-3-phosphate 1-O-acyltransferase PlsY [Dethiobacter sp.]|nr:glycerol-3-phosphate 1-O-acyltransferase PlsY [Dethiobacter sp.]
MNVIIALLAAYLIGSVSFGYMAGRLLKGVDIRQYGSGNTGSTNVQRTLGTGPGLLVFALDVAKGFSAIYIADMLTEMPLVVMLAGVAVVAGHNWPLFFGFKGGRGVATTVGVLAGLTPDVMLIVFIAAIAVIALTRYVSLGSITGAVLVPTLMVAFQKPPAFIFFGFVLAVLTVWRHKQNIGRLMSGTENKLGKRVAIDKKVEKQK